MDTVKIPLYGKDKILAYAIIEKEDLELVSKYRWYRQISHSDRKTKQRSSYRAWAHDIDLKKGVLSRKFIVSMGRLIMRAGEGEVVDHINHNTLDNRRSNLRVCSVKQNNKNISVTSLNTSGFKGVSFYINPKTNRSYWRARVKNEIGKEVSTYHKTKEEAAKSYDLMAKKYYGEFAFTNKDLNLL
jgi:hypothetical protein